MKAGIGYFFGYLTNWFYGLDIEIVGFHFA